MISFTAILFTGLFSAVVVAVLYSVQQHRRRLAVIEDYAWPPGLLDKLKALHPLLTDSETDRVSRGLKQFFRAYLNGGRRHVAMPSRVVDDLWHEFILYTRDYHHFCNNAFGRYLHHTPAVVLRSGEKEDNAGLRRVWWQACREEGIDPKLPKSLPLIFALDDSLRIAGGHHYTPNCQDLRRGGVAGTQCGGDFSNPAIDGSTEGLGDGDGGDGGCGGD